MSSKALIFPGFAINKDKPVQKLNSSGKNGVTCVFQRFLSSFGGLFLVILFVSGVSAQSTPISQIQGEGGFSPVAGKPVTTRGIVTMVVKKGFYIQTPDAEVDNNPKTSEGIYVFSNDTVPAEAEVGNLVEVSGTVSEYQPRAERYALKLTEITRPTVKVVSKGQPLPAPTVLTTAELTPQGKVDQMERFEGMRVKVNELTVVAPTGGYVNEKNQESKSNGIFWGVVAGTPRPFREPGIEVLTLLIDKLPQSVPMFDMNPELLRIDSNAQTDSKMIDVTAGATLKNLTGVVGYAFGAYTIEIDSANPPAVEGNKTFVPASPAAEREVTVGSFNLENFFDDETNSTIPLKETVYTKEAFQRRLNKASLAIRKVLSMPDVLGVIEVENLKVLQKLADKINADEVADGKPDPKYVPYLEEGNDVRGIDSGFLIKSTKIKVIEAKQLAKDEKLDAAIASSDEAFLFDRTPLLISVSVIDPKSAAPLAFTVIVNHLKSYRGIDDEKDGDRVRQKRRLEAEWLANFVQERAKTNPTERLIICGDFNAFQFNDGYNDLIGILKGKPEPNVLAPSKTVYQTGLIDLVDNIEAAKRYSYSFDGSAQVLDHILINKAAAARALKFGYARVDADFPEIYRNDPNRPERISDHDAPIFYMSLDEKK